MFLETVALHDESNNFFIKLQNLTKPRKTSKKFDKNLRVGDL